MFFVVKRRFPMEFRDRQVWLEEGEFLVRSDQHCASPQKSSKDTSSRAIAGKIQHASSPPSTNGTPPTGTSVNGASGHDAGTTAST
jgi:hypothetical protein